MKKKIFWLLVAFLSGAFLMALVGGVYMPYLASRAYSSDWVEISFTNAHIRGFGVFSTGWICADGVTNNVEDRNRVTCVHVSEPWFAIRSLRPWRTPPIRLQARDLLHQPTALQGVMVDHSHDRRTGLPFTVTVNQVDVSTVEIVLDRQ